MVKKKCPLPRIRIQHDTRNKPATTPVTDRYVTSGSWLLAGPELALLASAWLPALRGGGLRLRGVGAEATDVLG
jgi:hypothetical protein